MSKYIGTPVVSLVTDTVDVTGDITTTDATPEVIIVNDTHEDTDGGREGKVTFKGQQSGGEETTLAQIQASHDGTSDDEKGDLIFKVNDGSDGNSPTERLRIGSDGATTITTEGNEDTLVLKSNDADANAGPKLQFNRNSASPADDDLLGEIRFSGRNDAGQAVDYSKIASKLIDASDGTEDTRLSLKSIVAGTERERVTIQPTEVVINEDSRDLDFRVESDSNANTIFVDASEPSVGFGVGTGDTTVARMAVGLTGAAVSGDTDGATIGKGSTLRLVDDTNWGTTNSTIFLMGGGTGGAVGQISSAIGFARESNTTWGTQLKFYTHPPATSDLDDLDERARFTGIGQFMVNRTDGTIGIDGFCITPAGSGTGTFTEIMNDGGGIALSVGRGGSDGTAVQFRRGSGVVGSISVTGSATAYNTSSDHRLKENVETLSGAITRVKSLKPKRFSWIVDEEDSANVDGFLAHETATVVPEAINGTHNEVEVWVEGEELPEGVSVGDNKLDNEGNTIPVYQGIDQSKLVPLLTAALQEAIAKIETLETKVAALEGE